MPSSASGDKPYAKLPTPNRGTGARPNPTSVQIPLPPVDKTDPRFRAEKVALKKPRALTAAAEKVRGDQSNTRSHTGSIGWQRESWAMYDQVGELRYASNMYGNGMSQVTLEPTRRTNDGERRLCDMERLSATDQLVDAAMKELEGDIPLSELQKRMGLMLFVAGEALLVGAPYRGGEAFGLPAKRVIDRSAAAEKLANDSRMFNLVWRVYSREDVLEKNGAVHIGAEVYDRDEVLIIRVWRPHPYRYREADSPVRSTLPVLRELVGLTMYASAQIDSRLAGAGVLILPNSATVLGATPPEDDQEEDPTVAALIESMVTPIKDRDSAASLVPLVLTVPDESISGIQHLTFSSPLDSMLKDMRNELIRRLALGLDMPPEELLGVNAMSHWGQWFVQENTVRMHLIPGAELVAHALLTQYIRPILEEAGVSDFEASQYNFQVNAEKLISRPNNFTEQLELYQMGVIKKETILSAAGLTMEDAMDWGVQGSFADDPMIELIVRMANANPSLTQQPGLPAILSQLRAIQAGKDASNAPDDAMPNSGVGGDNTSGGRPPGQPGRPDEGAPEDRETNQPGPAETRPRDQEKP